MRLASPYVSRNRGGFRACRTQAGSRPVRTHVFQRIVRAIAAPGSLAALGGFVVPFAPGLWVITASGGSPMAGVFVGMAMGVTSRPAASSWVPSPRSP